MPADFDPEQLTESDIEKGGYRYQKSYLMLVSENTDVDTKLASQTVTVVHSEKDGASAGAALDGVQPGRLQGPARSAGRFNLYRGHPEKQLCLYGDRYKGIFRFGAQRPLWYP